MTNGINTYTCAGCGRLGAVNFVSHFDEEDTEINYCPECFSRDCQQCAKPVALDEDAWLSKGDDERNVGIYCCATAMLADGWEE